MNLCNARNTFTRQFLSQVVEFLKLIPYAALLKMASQVGNIAQNYRMHYSWPLHSIVS
jgi:hypothetical protein